MTVKRPTAYLWTTEEMLEYLIYVRDGRKVLGTQLLSTADFKGVTSASRTLVDDDKEVPVATLWLMDPNRISVSTVKDAWDLRKSIPDCPPWIRFSDDEGEDL